MLVMYLLDRIHGGKQKTENRSEPNAYLHLETGTYTLSFLFNHVVERVLLMLSVKSWCLKMSSYKHLMRVKNKRKMKNSSLRKDGIQ